MDRVGGNEIKVYLFQINWSNMSVCSRQHCFDHYDLDLSNPPVVWSWADVRAQISWIKCEVWEFLTPAFKPLLRGVRLLLVLLSPLDLYSLAAIFPSSRVKCHSPQQNGIRVCQRQTLGKSESCPFNSWDNFNIQEMIFIDHCVLFPFSTCSFIPHGSWKT